MRLSWAPISDLSQKAHPWTHADTHLLAASSSSNGLLASSAPILGWVGKDTATQC